MKIYKVTILTKIFIFVICVFSLNIGIIFLLYNTETTIFQQIIALFGIALFASGPYAMCKFKVIINDEKIEVSQINIIPFLLRQGVKNLTSNTSIFWNEVELLDSMYILFPEFLGVIILKSKTNSSEKIVKIPISGMSIELVRDIISHLPPETKVNLYSYLKRKLEGKLIWFYVK